MGRKEGVCVSIDGTEEEGISSISEALDSTARTSFLNWKVSSAWLLGLGGVQRRRTFRRELGCWLDVDRQLTGTRAFVIIRGAPPTANRLCTAARRMIYAGCVCGCVCTCVVVVTHTHTHNRETERYRKIQRDTGKNNLRERRGRQHGVRKHQRGHRGTRRQHGWEHGLPWWVCECVWGGCSLVLSFLLLSYRAQKAFVARSTLPVPRRYELPSSVQGSDWYRWNRADPGRAMVPVACDCVV